MEKRKGEVITFYSFKGGTGRTMALANIAVLAARSNKKILVIDWDLEAPGLHRYFSKYFPFNEDDVRNFPGLIDFFIKLAELKPTEKVLDKKSIIEYIKNAKLDNYILRLKLTGITLLKAGTFNDKYAETISKFNWVDFFHQFPDFFKIFAEYLSEFYDYILIDSRTGYTDSSGICTMLLPEKMCLVFTPNTQSLEGVCDLAMKALTYRMKSDDFRPLKLYPIPSRVEIAEKDLREQWRRGSVQNNIKGFQPVFERIFDEFYGTSHCDLTTYFDAVQIHHEPKFAYGEEIAVLNENYTDRLSLSKAYGDLFQKLTIDRRIFSETHSKGLPEKNRVKVFISYSMEDMIFAQELAATLTKTQEYEVVISSSDQYKIGENIFDALENLISNSHIFMPVVSEKYIQSRWAEFELYSFTRNKRSNEINAIIPVFENQDLYLNNRLYSKSSKAIIGFDVNKVSNESRVAIFNIKNLFVSKESS